MDNTPAMKLQPLGTEDFLLQMLHQEAVLKRSIEQHIQEIDQALAARDQALFIQLTNELKQLEDFSKK